MTDKNHARCRDRHCAKCQQNLAHAEHVKNRRASNLLRSIEMQAEQGMTTVLNPEQVKALAAYVRGLQRDVSTAYAGGFIAEIGE